MKKLLLLVALSAIGQLMFASVAFAQSAGDSASASSASIPQVLADGGGPAILLPAAALLLGSGILTYAILRRR